MARTILVVDDNAINRQILIAGLENDYDILEASNGKEALSVIHRRFKLLSAVLLDLEMPVLNGFEVLRQMQSSPLLSQIPVIVVTGTEDEDARLNALSLGANDFVHKPYNPEIIKHCLRNNINLRETASIVNAIQKDKLTGIYNREFFFEKAGEMIGRHSPGHYVLACFDIDNFKLVNDQYGAVEGDRILKHIGAEMLNTFEEAHGICGRISGDNFAGLFPNRPDIVETVTRNRETRFFPPDTASNLHFSVGRYIVTDPTLPVSALYDRAYIAKQSVKGLYDKHVAYFDDSMLRALIMEQEIIGEMDMALKKREFEVWFQPQYNHATGALIGAEALVRWRHPVRGMIMPGDFIHVFEKNGFVYELDKYVWEAICRLLRRWLDEGRNPLPVSINISRYDVFRDDCISVLTGLIAKYSIPVELLRLEITESAFSNASDPIIKTVKRFIELGFTVEIDDFGSAYSSLNTLKDVPAQILKLDMHFLDDSGSDQRGGNILESIVRMARWLGMAVIAEGVETVGQADFLKSIGCNYVQGFLYGRPMSVPDYEKLAKTIEKEERLITLETVVNLDSDSFWSPKSMDTLIFNSFVGGACIFEFYNSGAELLRISESYIRELGIRCGEDEPLKVLDVFNYLDESGKIAVRECAIDAIASKSEQTVELMLSDSGICFDSAQYIRCTLRVIASAGERFLFYCVISNITAQRLAEQKERETERKRLAAAEQLQAIIANIDGGVTAAVNRDGVVEYIFANDRFFELIGCTREEYYARFNGKLDTVHPDDRERISALAAEASRERKSFVADYRVIRSDGSVRWLRSSVTIMDFPEIDEPVQLAVALDITEQAEASEQLEFLSSMSRELLAQPDADESLNATLHKLRDYFGGSRAYIFEFDFEKDTASNTYEVCAEGVSREKDNLQKLPLGVMSFWLDAFKKQAFYEIDDVETLDADRAEEKEILLAQGIKAIFVVPLYRDGCLIGMIGVDDPKHTYSKMNRLVALGDYIAVMLTRRDLNARINGSESATSAESTPPGARGERREKKRAFSTRAFLIGTLAFTVVMAALLLIFSAGYAGNSLDSFAESVLTLNGGWTLTDSSGVSRVIDLPETIEYGAGGIYTLTGVLPESDEIISSPALCVYSNYVDLSVSLDGEPIYEYPAPGLKAPDATGNTYHYLRMPAHYGGKVVSVTLRCQLGDKITYLLKAPLLGSKATMLRKGVMESMPIILLAGCLMVLALVLAALYLVLRRRLDLNRATAFTALFALLFAAYVLCETSFAQLLAPDGYALFCATLMLLALFPIPLIGLFTDEVSKRFRHVPFLLMGLCFVNLLAQTALNFAGVMSFRVMLPATHFSIIISIAVMVLCLLLSDRREKPGARRKLLSSLPLLVGGMTDIILLALNRPSFNNSLWFTLGVTAFIAIQFGGFVSSSFRMYRVSLETSVLRDMAYRDALTNLGNRNAYERRLKELSGRPVQDGLCCIVLDINDLKMINDEFGHQAGDAAIVETGRILESLMPDFASCFRTGGDEFIVLLGGCDKARTGALAERIVREAARRGKKRGIPLSIAAGFGCYEREDGNPLDFIRRVDSLMYKRKREYKLAKERQTERA